MTTHEQSEATTGSGGTWSEACARAFAEGKQQAFDALARALRDVQNQVAASDRDGDREPDCPCKADADKIVEGPRVQHGEKGEPPCPISASP
jgi:hypothetical protein